MKGIYCKKMKIIFLKSYPFDLSHLSNKIAFMNTQKFNNVTSSRAWKALKDKAVRSILVYFKCLAYKETRLIIGWILLPVGVISPGDKRPGTEWGKRWALSCNTPGERLGGLPGLELLGNRQTNIKLKMYSFLEISSLVTFTC